MHLFVHKTYVHDSKNHLINIIGGNHQQRILTGKVVQWFLDNQLPEYNTLEIEINLIGNPKSTEPYIKKQRDFWGLFYIISHREFRIDVKRNLRLFDFICVICHELTHLKQLIEGRFEYIDENIRKWKGKVYDKRELDYNKRPWENEAEKLEEQYAIDCFKEVL